MKAFKMWPYVRFNPIGVIILILVFFSLYLIYSANSATNNFMRNYEEQSLMTNYRKKLHLDDDDELIPAFNAKRHSLINDEIIKQEFRLFEMVNLKELLNVAIQVAGNGGRQVRKVRELANYKRRDKGVNDPLTEADLRSHQVMVGQLSSSFPGVNIISEETGNNIKDIEQVKFHLINKAEMIGELRDLRTNRHVALSEITIWVDPLDATQEYTESLVKYVTTMVCVAYKGKPIIGVIHKPFRNTKLSTNHSSTDFETYWAWDGVASSKSLQNLIGKRRKDASQSNNLNVIVSRSHTGTVKSLSDNLFKGKNTKVISAGGSGYKSIELIKGSADIYLHNSLIKKWDLCAPNAIINSISDRVTANFTTLKGEPIKYTDENVKNHDGLLATVGLDHTKIVEDLRNII